MNRGLCDRSGHAVLSYCQLIGWRPDVVVQVGVGMRCKEAALFAEHWPGVSIFGFEPHPGTWRAISPIYPGVLFEQAVSDSPGVRKLHAKPKHADGSTLHEFADGRIVPTHDVICVTLDDSFRDSSLVEGGGQALLWLDCEGSEAAVIRGALELLKFVGVANIELTGRRPGPGWSSPIEVHRLMREAGFYHAWSHTSRVKGGQSDAIYVRRELFQPDLCCCPAEAERFYHETPGGKR